MNKLCTLIASVIALTSLASCSSLITQLSDGYPAKDKNAKVDIYLTNKPKHEYVDVALLHYDNILEDRREMNAAKKKARKIGADAIIIFEEYVRSSSHRAPIEIRNEEKDDQENEKLSTNIIMPENETRRRVVAIKYID